MHKQESVLENETHKILWYFEIHTDHLISTRKSDLAIIDKKNCRTEDFTFPADLREKIKENEKRDKYLELLREQSCGT